jgi:hypothetical protein
MGSQQLIDSILASIDRDIDCLQKLELQTEQVETLLEMRSRINNLILKRIRSAA